jgi:hypothetical protein
MSRFGKQQGRAKLDAKEMGRLGHGHTIFVCSGCDLFHPDIQDYEINMVLDWGRDMYPNNRYIWHTKNPARVIEILDVDPTAFPKDSMLCVTIESDTIADGVSKAPKPEERAEAMHFWEGRKMVTVEPVMKFEPFHFADMLNGIHAEQINIGADSGHNNLPEPSRGELEFLIERLAPHTKIHLKKNLRRLLPESRYYENC